MNRSEKRKEYTELLRKYERALMHKLKNKTDEKANSNKS